jgi:hypothetical protein
MGKLTWEQLGRILEDEEFQITPEEAAKIVFDTVLSKNWKGSDVAAGKMWQDPFITYSWIRVLKVFDKLIAKHGKSKAMKHFYEKDEEYFNWCLASKCVYTSEKTFRNDFAIFNKLPMFEARSVQGHGTKTRDKVEQKRFVGIVEDQKDIIALKKKK